MLQKFVTTSWSSTTTLLTAANPLVMWSQITRWGAINRFFFVFSFLFFFYSPILFHICLLPLFLCLPLYSFIFCTINWRGIHSVVPKYLLTHFITRSVEHGNDFGGLVRFSYLLRNMGCLSHPLQKINTRKGNKSYNGAWNKQTQGIFSMYLFERVLSSLFSISETTITLHFMHEEF